MRWTTRGCVIKVGTPLGFKPATPGLGTLDLDADHLPHLLGGVAEEAAVVTGSPVWTSGHSLEAPEVELPMERSKLRDLEEERYDVVKELALVEDSERAAVGEPLDRRCGRELEHFVELGGELLVEATNIEVLLAVSRAVAIVECGHGRFGSVGG